MEKQKLIAGLESLAKWLAKCKDAKTLESMKNLIDEAYFMLIDLRNTVREED